MNCINYNGEKITPIVLYGTNRPESVFRMHQKVMVEYFGLAFNYFQCPFPGLSHGACMDQIIPEVIKSENPDYIWVCDIDCIILKQKAVEVFYDLVKHKRGIASHVQNSNHKKNRLTESCLEPYCSQAFLWFPVAWYEKLNRPSMDHWSDGSDEYGGDTAEKLTIETRKAGGFVNILYPSSVEIANSDIGSGLKFGMGNIFGEDLVAHAMQQNNPESEKWFVEICEKVLNGDFEKN